MLKRPLTPAHSKVAREALGWTQSRLAEEAGLSVTTVKRFELEKKVHGAFADALLQAFTRSGIELFDEGSVVDGRVVKFALLLLDPKVVGFE